MTTQEQQPPPPPADVPGPPGVANGTPAGGSAPIEAAAVSASPELLVDSLGEYLRAWWQRIKGGESGVLPILAGLILIIIIFQVKEPKFLSALNIVNLFVQAAVFVLLGLAEIYALLLSEIDLSTGYVAGVGAFVIAELVARPNNWPWWLGVLGGLVVTALIGVLHGVLITRLHLPSFVVTLGGLLGWQGVMLYLADIDKTAVGGVISLNPKSPIYKLVNDNMSTALSWIVLVVLLIGFAAVLVPRAARRRARGLSAPPPSITILTIAVTAVAGVALVLICSTNRGTKFAHLSGVPWVVPFVLLIVLASSALLSKSRLGRYIYAIGANPEAARRAGINVARVRTIAFMLCSLTAGLAGLVYESRLGSIATDIDGGTLVLYAVAAAVIGGTSLFGGRGKAVHALLGGIVIAAVYNGLGLIGIHAAGQDMATAVVLIAAVTVDSLVRRRGALGT
ncbi:MAG: sugar ABC transporter permease [Acidimicrobiales bacterium]